MRRPVLQEKSLISSNHQFVCANTANATGEVEIITGSCQVQQRDIEIGESQALAGSDCEDLGSESDSDSSCTSSDSIVRNADFVTFN